MNGKVPFDAAEQNDAAGIKVVNDYIIYLGETITYCYQGVYAIKKRSLRSH